MNADASSGQKVRTKWCVARHTVHQRNLSPHTGGARVHCIEDRRPSRRRHDPATRARAARRRAALQAASVGRQRSRSRRRAVHPRGPLPHGPAPPAVGARRARAWRGPTWPATSTSTATSSRCSACATCLAGPDEFLEVKFGSETMLQLLKAAHASMPSARRRRLRRRRPVCADGCTVATATRPPSRTTTTSATTSTGWCSARAGRTRAPTGRPPTPRSSRPRRPSTRSICRKLGLQPGSACSTSAAAGARWRSTPPSTTACRWSASPCRRSSRRSSRGSGSPRPGWSDRVEIRLQDYRDVADGPFDAIQQHRHVRARRDRNGPSEYFAVLHDLLVPGGRLLNHAISRPEPSSKPAASTSAPSSAATCSPTPPCSRSAPSSRRCRTGLEVRDVESLREHYARTLRAWVANLETHWDDAQTLAGPGRARVWRLYMAASRDRLRAAPHVGPPGAGREDRAQRRQPHAGHPCRHRRRRAPRPHLVGLTDERRRFGRRSSWAEPQGRRQDAGSSSVSRGRRRSAGRRRTRSGRRPAHARRRGRRRRR